MYSGLREHPATKDHPELEEGATLLVILMMGDSADNVRKFIESIE